MWESPDGVTKNEIDRILTNKIKCVKTIEILYNFNYSSDHRLIKGSLEIPTEKKLFKNMKVTKLIILIHKTRTAKKMVANALKAKEFDKKGQVQDMYNMLEESIRYTTDKVGVNRVNIKTDDKLSENKKKLLETRKMLNSKSQKTDLERIELSEIKKLVRKKIL